MRSPTGGGLRKDAADTRQSTKPHSLTLSPQQAPKKVLRQIAHCPGKKEIPQHRTVDRNTNAALAHLA